MLKKLQVLSPIIALTIILFQSCNIEKFVAPNWEVEANLSFVNRNYTVSKMLDKQQNIYIDSVSNDVVLVASVDDVDEIGTSLNFDGIATKVNNFIFNRDTIINLDFDDSSYVREAFFINGNVNLVFRNNNSFPYNFTLGISNLKKLSTNISYSLSGTVDPNSTRSYNIPLIDYKIQNTVLLNYLQFQISSSASQQGTASFDYSVSRTDINFVSGKVKPLLSKNVKDTIDDPFGENAPENPLTISTIKKSEFRIRNYAESQITLQKAYFTGENKITHSQVRLLYDFDNNGTLDSFYNVVIPRKQAGQSYGEVKLNITPSNSNIISFLNNVPGKVFYNRDQVFNSDYQDATLDFQDSIVSHFYADVPLRFQTNNYNSYRDTTKGGFTQKQRDKINNISKINLTTTLINGIALKMRVKITVADSTNNPLLVLTEKVANPEADGFVTVDAADVGTDGTVVPGGQKTREIIAELNRDDIARIISFGKVFVEMEYITNPNAGLIRVRGDDFSIIRSIGVLNYVVEP
ncbi:MAG TPA: hypothetical protein VHP32_09455 [Ignavibacteria bacterium]|nr:hypothetical protein [Ignavibacteria bacterium]